MVKPSHEKILEILENSEEPLNTADVARKVGHSWTFVQFRLLELLTKGKINHRRAGTVHQWSIQKEND